MIYNKNYTALCAVYMLVKYNYDAMLENIRENKEGGEKQRENTKN